MFQREREREGLEALWASDVWKIHRNSDSLTVKSTRLIFQSDMKDKARLWCCRDTPVVRERKRKRKRLVRLFVNLLHLASERD